MDMARHQCLIYEGPPSRHLESLARTIISNLKEGKRCLYLNSPAMVAGIRSCLAALGLNLSEEIEKGSLIITSDQSHLVGGRFDVQRMIDMLRQAMHQALADGYTALWATGDMTWEFGSESNLDKLLDYEQQLEAFMQNNVSLSGICQYHRDTLPSHAIETGLQTHKALYINHTLTRINPDCACI